MPGTKEGGEHMRETMIEKLGSEEAFKKYMASLGKMGGAKGTTGGFYQSKMSGENWHIEAGRKGGQISKRGKNRGRT